MSVKSADRCENVLKKALLGKKMSICGESDYFIIQNRSAVVDSDATGDVPLMKNNIKNREPVYTVKAGGAPALYIFRTGCAPDSAG